MYVDAEANGKAQLAQKQDSRVIPACNWMRKSHVDELPQLFNIMRGEMSLVGPRPERPEMFEELTLEMPDYEDRLAVKPGLTGLAQIEVGYNTDIDSHKRKLEKDLEYIQNMCLTMELSLLVRTATKFFDDGGAH